VPKSPRSIFVGTVLSFEFLVVFSGVRYRVSTLISCYLSDSAATVNFCALVSHYLFVFITENSRLRT
jgi:hypothetical protein